jgi:hypothetical protein
VWVTLGTLYLSALCSPKVFAGDSTIYPANAAQAFRNIFSDTNIQSKDSFDIEVRKSRAPNVYETLYANFHDRKHLRTSRNRSQARDEAHPEDLNMGTTNSKRRLATAPTGSSQPFVAGDVAVRVADQSSTNHPVHFPHDGDAMLAKHRSTLPSPSFSPHGVTVSSESAVGARRLSEERGEESFASGRDSLLPNDVVIFFSLFFVAIGVSIATGSLLSFHLYLGESSFLLSARHLSPCPTSRSAVCTNQTTLELFQARLSRDVSRQVARRVSPLTEADMLLCWWAGDAEDPPTLMTRAACPRTSRR